MMSRLLMSLILVIGMVVSCRASDTLKTEEPIVPFRPQLYVQAGYLGETWTVSGKLAGAYTANTYLGTGGFVGLGFCHFVGNEQHAGFGLSVDYLTYNMQASLKKQEGAETGYSFARITPAAYWSLNPGAPINVQVSGFVNILTPLQQYSGGYYQLGLQACARYDAFGVNLAYQFAPSSKGPVTSLGDTREKTVSIAALVYPGRLKVWTQLKEQVRTYRQRGKVIDRKDDDKNKPKDDNNDPKKQGQKNDNPKGDLSK